MDGKAAQGRGEWAGSERVQWSELGWGANRTCISWPGPSRTGKWPRDSREWETTEYKL